MPKSRSQRLDAAAQAMIAAAAQGRSAAAVLKRLCPHVVRQLACDRRYPELLALWGRSVNVDENVGRVIVDPAILEAIGQRAGVRMRGRFVHAGLQHTYGYLFSLIETPFGRKRDRWIQTDLERGFGLEQTVFSERPRAGTLLGNLTHFLGSIVYRDNAGWLGLLQRNRGAAAPELWDYDCAGLATWRIEERVVAGSTVRRAIALRTDVVAYPHPPRGQDAEAAMLIYSVQRGRSRPKLITAFPIRRAAAAELRASAATGDKVRLRYNAYVPELYGRGGGGGV